MVNSVNSAHAKPPQAIRDVYKELQKSKVPVREDRFSHDGNAPRFRNESNPRPSLKEIFENFTGTTFEAASKLPDPETCDIPGLLIYRSLIPPEVQLRLLDKVFHQDLNNPTHLTNVHLHYDVPYPAPGTSYFDACATGLNFKPQDLHVHKPFDTRLYLDKKLRWMTLGGQYDWTNKVYPVGTPPTFPADIAKLIGSLFNMVPEAAIVNLYSPGDTLSLHRDVSEECNRPLASISIGCDGIFLVGLESSAEGQEPRMATLRLRSGDAVVMTGESRYAWHGIPKVIGNTCPARIEDWPCTGADAERFKAWRAWMKGKRINLNVRQMFA